MVALQCFAPQLIVLRVITGRAWTRDPSTMFGVGTRLEFTDRSTTRVGGSDKSDDEEKFGTMLASPVTDSDSVSVRAEVV